MNTITTAQAAAFLQAHDNYLILTHVRPDGDTIGCAVALCVEAGCQNRGPGLVLLDIEDRREERKLCLSWKKNSPRMRPEYISLIRENYGPEGLKPQL